MMTVDVHRSSRKQKWHLRFLLFGIFVAVSFENVSVVLFGISRGVISAGAGAGYDTQHFSDVNDRVESFAPRGRTLTDAQLRELTLFRQQHPSLWNHTNQTLLEQSLYVHFGKYQYQFYEKHPDDKIERSKILFLLDKEEPSLIADSRVYDLFDRSLKQERRLQIQQSRSATTDTNTWVLPNPLKHPTRNHDTIILEHATGNNDSIMAVTLLGRHSRYVQWMDLVTGQQWSRRTANVTDPEGMPLDDLNHVSAVLVDSLPTKNESSKQQQQEIWLPCGFHNDRVNSEVSTSYARIVDVATMRVRTGPKLPIAGGACVATAVNVLTDEPPMICNFGGTQGTHDKGIFLKETACYDRRRETWWSPFGNLPYGLDHGSLAFIPAGVCHHADPARLIILNFRTKPYGDAHPEMLAYDIQKAGWTLEDLQASLSSPESKWYIYYNDTRNEWEDTKDVGRDASGTIMVNGGRQIVNFGGTYHYLQKGKRKRGRFSMIRSFDVCKKEWSVIGDLGLQTFALQTAASEDLQLAITCGGEAPMKNSNGDWCFVNRFHNNMRLSNRYEQQIDTSLRNPTPVSR